MTIADAKVTDGALVLPANARPKTVHAPLACRSCSRSADQALYGRSSARALFMVM